MLIHEKLKCSDINIKNTKSRGHNKDTFTKH